MASVDDPGPAESDDLQFDRAEFSGGAPAAVVCAGCKQPVPGEYYEINGTIVCDDCRLAIGEHLRGGSRIGRFVRAGLYGLGAATLGTIIYVLFLSIFPVDIAIVAILVGFLVGKLVRKGSAGRGGLVYQLMAIFLTYSSLAMTYFTILIMAYLKAEKGAAAEKPDPPAMVKPAPPGKVEPAPARAPGAAPRPKLSPGQFVLGLATLFGLAYVTPVLLVKESPIMLAFVGFALWEAWKYNRPARFVVTGPYRVGEGPPGGLLAHA